MSTVAEEGHPKETGKQLYDVRAIFCFTAVQQPTAYPIREG